IKNKINLSGTFMKNLTLAAISFALLLIISLSVISCNDDSEAPTVLQLVSSTGQTYVSEDRKLAGGSPVNTGVYAQAPSADVTLTNFKVTFTYDTTSKPNPINVVTYLDSTLAPNTSTFAMVVPYVPRNQLNKEIWRFTITDSKGKEYNKIINLSTTSANTTKSTIYTYTNVVLSRVKNPRNSLDSLGFVGFNSALGTSFPAYAVKQPSLNPLIDLFFNKSGTSKPSLSLAGIKGDSLRLTTLTSPEFDAVNNVSGLNSAYPAANPSYATIENLQPNQVLAYKTVNNKVGLLRINTVYKTLDSLGFDVKVQK
ncbi:MAG: hypothetical protein M3Q05_09335, partial [Bacteroidota bacterium]|nr:hypothetical protein [Bacteroidota bacterium]